MTVLNELAELRGLPEGWDGESAAASCDAALNEAECFVRIVGSAAAGLSASLHADGSVLLEIGDGSSGSLRFRGDGTIVYSIKNEGHGCHNFDQKSVSPAVLGMLVRATAALS